MTDRMNLTCRPGTRLRHCRRVTRQNWDDVFVRHIWDDVFLVRHAANEVLRGGGVGRGRWGWEGEKRGEK